MRRTAPRPLSGALEAAAREAAPRTLLGRVQAAWPQTVGPALAAEASPVSERGGAVTVECRSATWAQELALLERDLRERLNRALPGNEAAPVTTLRFRTGPDPAAARAGRPRRRS